MPLSILSSARSAIRFSILLLSSLSLVFSFGGTVFGGESVEDIRKHAPYAVAESRNTMAGKQAGNTIVNDSINLRLSVGSSWQARNDVQIPNTELGTRFSLYDAAGSGPVSNARLEINWSINKWHGVRVLLAPLSYTKQVTFDQPVLFAGETFNAEQSVDATYRFNSWRLGYHYLFRQNNKGSLRIGGTLKIRDAEIRLEQGDTVSYKDDLGIVPLLYLKGNYRLSDRWTMGADLDGLAGGPGRAIDLGLMLDYSINKRWQIGADVRLLDGGADTDEVYNFARFHSAAIAVSTIF